MSQESIHERLARHREESEAAARRNRLFTRVGIVIFVVLVIAILALRWSQSGPLDLNHASAKQLETLPGIGPSTAKAIVNGRPYETIEDLRRVKGIGPATIEKVRERVQVK